MNPALLARARRFRLPDPTLRPPQRIPTIIVQMGACTTSADPRAFDVDDRAMNPAVADQAQALCDLCPVRRACLAYALDNEPFGFWGGTDALERLERRGRPLPDPDERLATHELRVRLLTGTSARTVAEEFGVSLRTIERWKRAAGIRLVEVAGPTDPSFEVRLAA